MKILGHEGAIVGSAPDSVNGPLGLQLTNKGLEWAERIGIAWGKSKEAIFETGRLLVQAKAELAHGEWQKVCASQHFHNRTAERLMAISRDERLLNPTHVSLLPNEWGTLYEITRLDDEAFARRLDDGTINPTMERSDLKRAQKSEKAHEADKSRAQQVLRYRQIQRHLRRCTLVIRSLVGSRH